MILRKFIDKISVLEDMEVFSENKIFVLWGFFPLSKCDEYAKFSGVNKKIIERKGAFLNIGLYCDDLKDLIKQTIHLQNDTLQIDFAVVDKKTAERVLFNSVCTKNVGVLTIRDKRDYPRITSLVQNWIVEYWQQMKHSENFYLGYISQMLEVDCEVFGKMVNLEENTKIFVLSNEKYSTFSESILNEYDRVYLNFLPNKKDIFFISL